jgi:beta-phosphoglucomutase
MMKPDFFSLNGGPVQGAIFDLDGVLVDTAKYHYLAWRRLAQELGFDFSEQDNERLKGVSRMRSLEILLEIGNYPMTDGEKAAAAARKNAWYVEYLHTLDKSAVLPGSEEVLESLKARGIKIALGSASKNAPLILERLGIAGFFDAVIDGNAVSNAKPNPEVFLKGAEALGISPHLCVVFEDALAGIEAARSGGMRVIAIGNPELLPGADRYITCLKDLLVDDNI